MIMFKKFILSLFFSVLLLLGVHIYQINSGILTYEQHLALTVDITEK